MGSGEHRYETGTSVSVGAEDAPYTSPSQSGADNRTHDVIFDDEAERQSVLLVDDDRLLCDSLASLLRVVGYDVENVYSGSDALSSVGRGAFDAAIVDINLPDVTGLEVLRGLKTMDSEIGVLMLSGVATREHALEALNSGADAFVLKPTEPHVLLEKLSKVVRVKRLQQRLRESEARYRELFENIGDGTFQSDLDGNFVVMNRAGAHILGFEDPRRLLSGGLKVWDTYISRDEMESLYVNVVTEGQVRGFLRRFRRRDGSLGWLETTIKTRRRADGELSGFEGIFRDVTDRLRYQEMLETLYGLWADLDDVSTLDEVVNLTLEFLDATLPLDSGGIYLYEEKKLKRVGRGLGVSPSEMRPNESIIVSRAMMTGEAQIVDDIGRELDGEAEDGMNSVLAVPVRRNGKTVALIDIRGSKPNAFTDEDKKLVDIVADHVANTLDRLIRSKLEQEPEMRLRDFL
ncbi:MAG TPA: response regulator [Patescibacteria group bacterium]|nr:response regulator [Patescibacteria group bacterium]